MSRIFSEQVLVVVGAQREILELGGELGEVRVVVPLEGGVDVVGHGAPILIDVTIIGPELRLLPDELPDVEPVVEVRAVVATSLEGAVAVPVIIIPILRLEISSKSADTVVSVEPLVILLRGVSVVRVVVVVLPVHGVEVHISVILVPHPAPLGVVILTQGVESVVQHVVVVIPIPSRAVDSLWW